MQSHDVGAVHDGNRIRWLAPCFALAPLVAGNKPLVLGLLIVCHVMANCWLTLSAVLATEVAPPGIVATDVATLSAFGGAASIVFNHVAGPMIDLFG